MVAEKCRKQVPYTVCKPVHYTKTIQVRALRAEAGRLHGDPLRAEGGLQAGAGAGLLPVPLRMRTFVRLREVNRGFGRKSDLCPEWRRDRFGPSTAARFARTGPLLLIGGLRFEATGLRYEGNRCRTLLKPQASSLDPQCRIDPRVGQALRNDLGPAEIVRTAVLSRHGDGKRSRRHRRSAAVVAVFQHHHLRRF